MSGTKQAIIYAIKDGKKWCDKSIQKRIKRQVYKVLISDVLDDNGNCFISEMYEKEKSGWREINCAGYILTNDECDTLKFFNKHSIDLDKKLKGWNDIVDKEFIFLL